ncbi:MAG TPA: hypothetical protein DHV67_02915 [Gallionella sp.]|nr:hypothetical protein [Gallionella sp.]
MFYRYPNWAHYLLNHYWHIRNIRKIDATQRRKRYRLIAMEKKRLLEAGVDAETIRLLCRHLVNLRNSQAETRFWNEHHKKLQKSLF